MSEYLPEPWRTDDAAGFPGDVMAGTEMVARTVICGIGHGIAHANARRIVACVNACAGVSTENLEDNAPVLELALRYNAVIKQRDDLLALMIEILPLIDHHGDARVSDRIRAAIANAEKRS